MLKKYISGIWNNMTHFNIPIIGVSEEEKQSNVTEHHLNYNPINYSKSKRRPIFIY